MVGAGAGCSWLQSEEHPTGEDQPAEHPTEAAEEPTEHPTSVAPVGLGLPRVAALHTGVLVMTAAAEHPAEHPKPAAKKAAAATAEGSDDKPAAKKAAAATAEGSDHKPATSAAKPKPKALTKEGVGKSIETYIAHDAKLKGGFFLVYDPVDKGALVLTLDKVHKDRLSITDKKNRIAFACSDFKTPKGKVYDLDFWMKQDAAGKLQVTQVMVHKEDGKPRYTWHKDGDTWKMKPAK